jgi:hypothetical protein
MDDGTRTAAISWRTWAGLLGGGMVLVLVVLVMLGSQVSGILSTVGASVGSPNGGSDQQPDGGPGPDGGDGSGAGGSGSGGAGGSGSGRGIVLAVPRDDVLVIKHGTISLRVPDISSAVQASTERVAALGGYASGSKRSGTGEDLQATGTFRIPSAQWDAALNALRSIGEVLDEETATDDVTTQVVDLGARIRNLQVTEQALQQIMDRATGIKDVLTVQDQLTTTRGEIEQLTSEKAHLEEQAAWSTITATFSLPPEPAVVVAQTTGFDPAAEVDAATAKLIRALQKVARAGIWFGIVWLPILLVIAIGGGIAFLVGRRVVRWWGRLHPVDMLDAGGAGSS